MFDYIYLLESGACEHVVFSKDMFQQNRFVPPSQVFFIVRCFLTIKADETIETMK